VPNDFSVTANADVAALTADLQQRFDVVETRLVIGGRDTTMLHPRNADALIDDAEFERDERLPYWADLWPSGRVLAETVAALTGASRPFLELGCGAGLVAVAAVRAGFDVTATDYDDDALTFTRRNVLAACGMTVTTRNLDWRAVPRDLRRFDYVVGADVLYERTHAALVARAFDVLLAAGGIGIVADPGRIATPAFIEHSRALGFGVETLDRVPFADGAQRQTISLYRIARA
jgi:predicted nicotinamide N-methyase